MSGMVSGIDVSHYEGLVQVDEVAAAGQGFVLMKATEGLTVDPTFHHNREAVKSAGLKEPCREW